MAGRRDWGRVRQLPSGRWQARYPGPDDVLRPAPDTFSRKRDAAEWLVSKRAEILRDEWIDPTKAAVTLDEFGMRWIEERKLEETSRERYLNAFKGHISPVLGTRSLDKIKEQQVRSWRKNRQDHGVGQPSIAKAYRLLHAIMETAVDDGLIRRNPCRIKGAGKDGSAERTVLTVPEVFAVADAIPKRYRALVLLAAFTSLRFGELAALRRNRVDLETLDVAVREAQAELQNGKKIIKAPKSEAGKRDVSIPDLIKAVLKHHLDEYADPASDGFVFIGPRGGRLQRHNFRRIWRKAVEDSKIRHQDVHFHDLRHTGNDLAAKAGASTKELMARMGHASMRAAIIYQHSSRERDREIAKAISANAEGARQVRTEPPEPEGHAEGTQGAIAS
ncbi:tyrosine-type recombinase/integrase [Fodinicola acaciae]|uniref:tyrosine-type recombinase/integrase n=1 Tax=Fodinicola acaciae TaxID=2681555 RepID=UPI0013D15256|nr:site-specific integrase [Fodinicola acaciae]